VIKAAVSLRSLSDSRSGQGDDQGVLSGSRNRRGHMLQRRGTGGRDQASRLRRQHKLADQNMDAPKQRRPAVGKVRQRSHPRPTKARAAELGMRMAGARDSSRRFPHVGSRPGQHTEPCGRRGCAASARASRVRAGRPAATRCRGSCRAAPHGTDRWVRRSWHRSGRARPAPGPRFADEAGIQRALMAGESCLDQDPRAGTERHTPSMASHRAVGKTHAPASAPCARRLGDRWP